MPNVYEKDKPFPENRPESPKRKRYSVWTIIGILVVLALLIWIFAFSYGEKTVSMTQPNTTGSVISAAGALTG